jgi:serine/arginine repetitive matrix protein 1
MKFPPEFDKKVGSKMLIIVYHLFILDLYKVDMRKVNLTVIRPWIAKKVVELAGLEDELVVEYAMGLLEDKQEPVGAFFVFIAGA